MRHARGTGNRSRFKHRTMSSKTAPIPIIEMMTDFIADIGFCYAFAVQYSTCLARTSRLRYLLKYQVPMPIIKRC
jgi:hypothetical protein